MGGPITRARFLFATLVGALPCMTMACADPGAGDELSLGSLRELTPDVPPGELRTVTDGNRRLAFDLYQALRTRHSANLVTAPYGIATTLAMCFAGARGDTETEMRNALRFGLPQPSFHRARNALDLAVTRAGVGPGAVGSPLALANGLWADRSLPVLEEYEQILATNYGAELRRLDFADDPGAAGRALSEWACEQTDGAVCTWPSAPHNDTSLVVGNAIHFHAPWKVEFPTGATRTAKFRRLDGVDVEVSMMEVDMAAAVGFVDEARIIDLAYAGDGFSMLLIVPALGTFEQVEGSLDAPLLQRSVYNLERETVTIALPRFTIQSLISLRAALVELGMPSAFDDSVADFSGIAAGAGLSLDTVEQHAVIEVTEQGTEASAITAGAHGLVSDDTPNVTVASPFLFVILERSTATPLFIGRVVDPSCF